VGTSQILFRPEEFEPRWWLRGAHAQTLAGFFLARGIKLPPPEARYIEVASGIKLLCHCHWQAERSCALTVIIVHGLEGSSDSGYVVGITEKALATGMNVVRVNQRNCGGTDHLAPTLYNSSLSGDLRAVADDVVRHDKVTGFALVGFSMGGNLVLKAAGEWGREAPPEFRAVVAVCPAMDLAASADALHLRANRVYEQYFVIKLRQRFRHKARLFPGQFDPARLRGVRTLREFDDRITAYYCGFAGADDYYARAAASNVLDFVAVPALILHAANDPFIRILPPTRAKIAGNPNVAFFESADGGHCAFLAEANGYDGRWAERQVVEFLRRFPD
jgi:predicted alpha/beta-fold hydrolase